MLLGGPRQKPQDGHSTLQGVASSVGQPVLSPMGVGEVEWHMVTLLSLVVGKRPAGDC